MRIDYPTLELEQDLRILWKQAFGDTDAFLDSFFSTAFSPERCRVATENGQVAAALYWMNCECDGRPIAYIYAVATSKTFRNRGLCRMMMEDVHRLLAEQGYDGAMLVPGSSALAAMYTKIGYRYRTQIREFFCTAAPEPVPLHAIDAAEYARLRRELLPKGSVMQEDGGLAFLNTQAVFYAGTHLLLAARKDGSQLFGLELLGDSAAAPGILSALGAAQGRFRTPGEGRPFAMYRPVSSSPAPAYFAFAFD